MPFRDRCLPTKEWKQRVDGVNNWIALKFMVSLVKLNVVTGNATWQSQMKYDPMPLQVHNRQRLNNQLVEHVRNNRWPTNLDGRFQRIQWLGRRNLRSATELWICQRMLRNLKTNFGWPKLQTEAFRDDRCRLYFSRLHFRHIVIIKMCGSWQYTVHVCQIPEARLA